MILDLRPPSHQSLGMPAGIGHRSVAVKVGRMSADGRRIGDVIAKRVRGEAAHELLEAGADPAEPDAVPRTSWASVGRSASRRPSGRAGTGRSV